jgi:hypothetical protein
MAVNTTRLPTIRSPNSAPTMIRTQQQTLLFTCDPEQDFQMPILNQEHDRYKMAIAFFALTLTNKDTTFSSDLQ